MPIKDSLKHNVLLSALASIYQNYFAVRRKKFGYIDKTAIFRLPLLINGIQNVYMYEHTHIYGHSRIQAGRAKFIMKKYSGAATGLNVVTGNHEFIVGKFGRDVTNADKSEYGDADVVVEEDVFIMSNVTILAGVTVGRGSLIGSGAVLRKSVPPYSIVIGNPAQVVGFKFTPDEIIEHEKQLYSEDERLPREMLEKNFTRYMKQIAKRK